MSRSSARIFLENAMRVVVIWCLLLLSPIASAGPIGDLFADGVFGLTWGSTRDQVEAKFPGGKWETKFGITTYTAHDSRAVLGVERKPKNTIGFVFNADQMSSVAVEFPGGLEMWATLLQKTEAAFGARMSPKPEAAEGVVSTEWEREAGIKLSLVNMIGLFGGSKIFLSIANTTPTPKSKKELGLQ